MSKFLPFSLIRPDRAARGRPRLPAAARRRHPADCPDGGMRCAKLITASSPGTAVPSGILSGRGNALREAGHGFQPRHGSPIRQTAWTGECAARG